MASDTFKIIAEDRHSQARQSSLETLHGAIETPMFMPVGTQGTVKGMTPTQLHSVGTQILLGNTYHLHLRPGAERIQQMGGLHQFMAWQGPILTDSGGFQAFSLSKLRTIQEDGIAFRSHLDGSPCFLGPQEVVTIQQQLGSDIAMVIDECLPYPCELEVAKAGVERTLRWGEECQKIAREKGFLQQGHHLFAIVQGGTHAALRGECAKALSALDFSGYAIGGVSVGEPEEEMVTQVQASVPYLPRHKPRYVMGVGAPVQLLKLIREGVDLFDCVIPSREARHGIAYTPEGRINLRNQQFADDPRPLVEGLDNETCRHFSRAYLRHLMMAKELLACVLLTLHNIHFFLDLMAQVREHIRTGDYLAWSEDWIERYLAGSKN